MATTITNQLLKCWLSVAAAAATVRAAAVATAAAVAAEITAVAKIELAQHSLAALDLLAALHAAPMYQRPALQPLGCTHLEAERY